MRLVLCYSKLGPMAFVAHLDFQQLWWRILRLARLSPLLTQGYNPRPKLRFATPLATGFQGERELLEVYLARDEEDVLPRINCVLPRGLTLLASTAVAPDFPKITALVDALAYRVELPGSLDSLEPVRQRAGDNLLTVELEGQTLRLLLKVENQKTLRPDVLVGEIFPGQDPRGLAIIRTGIFARKNEKIKPEPTGLFLLP